MRSVRHDDRGRRPNASRPPARRRDHRRRPAPEGLEGRALLSTFSVRVLDDGGPGSLRQAILDANARPGADVIAFEVAGTIALSGGPLPAIAGPVDIDGTTSPAFGTSGRPAVEVDFNGFDGLVFAAGSRGSSLRSLAIVDAGGHGVTLDAGGITVVGNSIGVRLDGSTPAGNAGDGIRINASSSRNVIGGPLVAQARNVISANGGDGIAILGSPLNRIVANYIGTDAAGTADLGNAGNGLRLSQGARRNVIGGDTPLPVAPTGTGTYNGKPVDGNVISGNGLNGVLVTAGADANVLSGNFIGTDVGGNAAIGNALDGVAIVGAHNNQILGTPPDSTPLDRNDAFLFYNVIGGNGGNGLRIRDAMNTRVWANFFGIGADNQTRLGNGLDGTLIEGRSAGTAFGGIIPFGNVAAANGMHGLEIRDRARGTTVGNTFAGTAAFNPPARVGNFRDGIHITATGGVSLLTNILSGNLDDGIEISGDARGVRLVKSIAGLDTTGQLLQPNGDNGVEIGGNAHDNLVGGIAPSVIPRSTFSGNLGHGIAIVGNAHRNRVLDAFVGTDSLGNQAFGNHRSGVFLGGGTSQNVVGGQSLRARLLVGANGGDGIELAGGTSGNLIVGNIFGDRRPGDVDFANAGDGLSLADGARENTIVGNSAVANLGDGFDVGSGDRNRLVSNLAARNLGFGFFVSALGSDTFRGNRCDDNGLGGSNLPGICEPIDAPSDDPMNV